MDDVLMLGRIRDSRQILLVLPVACWLVASCTVGGGIPPISEGSTSSSSSSGAGGAGGDPGPCGMDCSQIETPPCLTAVCNTGQVIGPLNTCVVVPSPKGTECDDGKFCTMNDTCYDGACVGGTTNNCGIKPDPCSSIICYEDLKSCDTSPVSDGAPCTPTDLCRVNGVCKIGQCVGELKDCAFSPLSECNTVACDSATGKCAGTPDPLKDNAPCVLTGDLCNVKKICQAGQCVGGIAKDCSGLDVGCELGACNPASGICGQTPAPVGTSCTPGMAECQVGSCDIKGECLSSAAPDNTTCNDYNACTKADKCLAGQCVGGNAVDGCSTYLQEGFETCPSGWTFGGDWECGKPANVGPAAAHIGNNVIATQVAGNYHVNQAYNAAFADSPPINLTTATAPRVSFWAWVHTEGGSFDGWNLKISTNGGQTFTQVTTVTPAYNLNIAGQQAWGGDHSLDGWQNYSADLSAFAGQSVVLRFSFRSDGATVFPGVYVDEVVVAEPIQIPIYITTSPPLPDVYAGMAYSAPMAKVGGSSGAAWTVKAISPNANWVKIDPMTGMLYGTPTSADVGLVTISVRAEESMLPSNFAERLYTFYVKPNVYYTSFEGMCPDGWTLTGDWQCGVPTMVGPATAYIGTQCLATQIAGAYTNLQSYAGTTATSPEIDLTASPSPMLTFRMWIDTEGSTYDGANLQISTDGGMTYSVVTGVAPAYPLIVATQPAWGGHQSGIGWQFVQADLSPYAAQKVRLRFAFRSDSSGTYPGVYIDDIFVN